MSWIRFAVVKLIALALIAAGLAGLRNNEFSRTFVQNNSYTFSKATPQELDAMFAEATNAMEKNYRDSYGTISRDQSKNATTLSIAIQADSWGDLSNAEVQFRSSLENSAKSRKLAIIGTSASGGSRMPEVFKSRRMNFIASSALTAFGIAMLILSFRVFGGGRREEVPDLDALKSTQT